MELAVAVQAMRFPNVIAIKFLDHCYIPDLIFANTFCLLQLITNASHGQKCCYRHRPNSISLEEKNAEKCATKMFIKGNANIINLVKRN